MNGVMSQTISSYSCLRGNCKKHDFTIKNKLPITNAVRALRQAMAEFALPPLPSSWTGWRCCFSCNSGQTRKKG